MSSSAEVMTDLDRESHLFLPEMSSESAKVKVMTRRLWALGLVSTALAGALVGSAIVKWNSAQGVDPNGVVTYAVVPQKDAPVCSGRSHLEVVSVASLWSPPADKTKKSMTPDFVTKGIWRGATQKEVATTNSGTTTPAPDTPDKPDTYFRIQPVLGQSNIDSLSLRGQLVRLAVQAGKAATFEMRMTDLDKAEWSKKDKKDDLSLTFLDLDVHGANAEFLCIEGEMAFEASLTPSSKIIETTHGKGTCFQATESNIDNPTDAAALSLSQLDRSVTITFAEYDPTKPISVRIGSSGQARSDLVPHFFVSAMPILKCPMANPSGITTFRDSQKELADTIHKLIKRVVSDNAAATDGVAVCKTNMEKEIKSKSGVDVSVAPFDKSKITALDDDKKKAVCDAVTKTFGKCVKDGKFCDSMGAEKVFADNKAKYADACSANTVIDQCPA